MSARKAVAAKAARDLASRAKRREGGDLTAYLDFNNKKKKGLARHLALMS